MANPTPCGSLHSRTLELVRALPRTTPLSQISEATGLPHAWLTSFSRGEIDHPSVNRVQILFEHLVGHPLEVR
jgi:hypothetical protein